MPGWRFAVIQAFMLWQGGFLFYGAVVVPISSGFLESDRMQGFITARVTVALNVTGCLALAILLAEWYRNRRRSRDGRRRLGVWLLLLATQLALFAIHPAMRELMNETEQGLREVARFRSLHRWYLRVSTLQWLAGMAYLGLTLQSWREQDRERR